MQNYTALSSNRRGEINHIRLIFLWAGFVALAGLVLFRLIVLMLLQHNFYLAISSNSRESTSKLIPKRGAIYFQDSRSKEIFPAAMNHDNFLLYADTRDIKNDAEANLVVNKLTEVFGYNDEKKLAVFQQLNKRTDPYEPIEKKISEDQANQLKQLNLLGLGFVRQPFRYYPEEQSGAGVLGFLGQDQNGNQVGRYGVEGFWNKELGGSGGFVEGAKNAVGGWITLSGWSLKPAKDGADMVLTIDRTLQYKACERLRAGMKEYNAVSADLVMMNPTTGAILAMCSLPDYNLNKYGEVTDAEAFNNNTIFTAYEPGSIFKPITMAAGIDEGIVKPGSPFYDTGARTGLCSTPIQNANDKIFGNQTMTGVLENSINTGMVYVVEKLGRNKFIDYVQNYGFGIKSGIEMDTEVAGDIRALMEKKNTNKIDCQAATASFGQGIMVTPLQMTTAFSAVVNGGKLMKPYVVEEIRYSDGRTEKKKPTELKQVLSKQAADLTAGMLVSVIEKHSTGAKVPGYYVGGKTGTAQIAGPKGYTEETNQSFIGFAPAEDPKFVILVKYEKPDRVWAESTALPVFKDIAQFALEYYHIAPNR